ncbi:MAG: hypothetical protein ABIP75_05530 [Pyrinomonadaceae bacterium]
MRRGQYVQQRAPQHRLAGQVGGKVDRDKVWAAIAAEIKRTEKEQKSK